MWKVLIADDEPKIRRGLRTTIERLRPDMKVVAEAEDGEMALEAARREKPDILMIDVRMPFLNGLELIEKIKGVLSDCIIIVVSGHDEFEYAQRALQLKVFDYVLKPVPQRGAGRRADPGRGSARASAPPAASTCHGRTTSWSATCRCCASSSSATGCAAGSRPRRSPSRSSSWARRPDGPPRWPWSRSWTARCPPSRRRSGSAVWRCTPSAPVVEEILRAVRAAARVQRRPGRHHRPGGRRRGEGVGGGGGADRAGRRAIAVPGRDRGADHR